MSAQTHKGIIDVVNKKPWQDRNTGEPITLYSFTLQGTRRWFRTGTTPVPFGVGDAVTFVADGQNVDVSSMAKSAEAVLVAPTPPAPPPGETSRAVRSRERAVASKDEYWANKEARDLAKDERFNNVDVPRMTRSASVSAAAAVVDAALKTEALSFGNVAKSKRIPMLSAFVRELAEEFYEYIMCGPTATGEAASSETEVDVNDE